MEMDELLLATFLLDFDLVRKNPNIARILEFASVSWETGFDCLGVDVKYVPFNSISEISMIFNSSYLAKDSLIKI